MNDRQKNSQPSSSLALGDIYYVLFRHKWMILILSVAGVVAGVAFHSLHPSPFQSEAKIFIPYVINSKAPTLNADNSRPASTEEQGRGVINSEIEILTSLDLAQQVVDALGASNILAKAGGGDDRLAAAAFVRNSLDVQGDENSSVVDINFKHPNAQIVQPVLQELISDYAKRSVEIHQGVGLFDDFLAQRTSQLRSQIDQTEADLQDAKNKAGIISVDGVNQTYSDQISKIRQQLLDAETELAAHQTTLKEIKGISPSVTTTNSLDTSTNQSQVENYKDVSARLDVLRKKRVDYLTQGFSEKNVLVEELRDQIADAQKLKDSLEQENPKLATLGVLASGSSDGQAGGFTDVNSESALVAALESKTNMLSSRLADIRAEAITVDQAVSKISDLQQKKQQEETSYQYYSSSLEHAQVDASLGSGKIANIKVIQSPSPPFKAESKKTSKITMMIMAGGIAGGLALAFLIELVLDRSVKRPSEIETKLGIPLFLSIPYLNASDRRRLITAQEKLPLQLKDSGADGADTSAEKNGRLEIAPWGNDHALRPFYEALRDRLINYFEAKNVTRKPKLVAVTSPGKGSGVSTIAVGLAASLSETGDGNVLLVSMNSEHDITQAFHKGRPDCKLDDVLENGKRENALVQENLYVVTEGAGGGQVPRFLPKRFMTFLPKLKASDYDYIIFDMPPITQTSITPRLATFMDMTLIVVESEKTDQDLARRASALLLESKANVSIVLNKTRKYIPARLHQEFLSDT